MHGGGGAGDPGGAAEGQGQCLLALRVEQAQQQVTRHAQEFVEELNARAAGKGRSMWAPRQRGKAAG